MPKKKSILDAFLALLLTFSLLATSVGFAHAEKDKPPKADPNLLQLAGENPDLVFPVIVQKIPQNKDLPDEDPENAVEKANGKVNREKKMDFIASFSAELTGKEIGKLAKNPKVRWISLDAPLFTSAAVGSTVLDAFSAATFNGNNGTLDWRSNWTELGERDGASTGKVKVAPDWNCAAGYCLQIGANYASIAGMGVSRDVDLKYATAATLSFKFRRSSGWGNSGSLSVQISNDLGNNWTTLATYGLNESDSSQHSASFDILAYASRKTEIRFIGSGTANRTIFIDDVKIDFSITTNQTNAPNFKTVRDDFMSGTYSENAGTHPWSSDWIESDASGAGASGGNIQVVASSTRCLSGAYCLCVSSYNAGDNIYRTLDLSQAASASLTFWRNNLLAGLNNNDSIVLEISTDGANWSTLDTWKDINEDIGAAYESFDITPYISANTLLRFRVASRVDNGYITFDNIQVQSTPLLNTYSRVVGAEKLWKEPPYLDGSNVTVAVVDSGISPHSDLQLSGGGSSRVIASTSLVANTTPADGYGHGTHVAGIITGNGNSSGGKRVGIAPNVNLVNVKVSSDYGLSRGSDLVAGLQWVYDNRTTYNIKVVNISMNSSVPESYQTSPIDAAVEILWFNGIVVVVSAGNSGRGSLNPPANDPFVITVGAMDDMGTISTIDDGVATFSSYATTEDGFVKPDLVAPGRNIISLLASTNASLYLRYPTFRVDDSHFRMSGTSMSAPVVSGAVALMLQDEPTLNPDQVKYRLLATANKTWPGYNAATAGAGYLDIYAAVKCTTTVTANSGIAPSQMLSTGLAPISWGSVAWNSVAWNSVAWNSVAWNSVAWNSVAWNSVAWNSVAWNSDYWGEP
jgi:serine protease AprX